MTLNGLRCPLPARASFRDLIRDLLGRDVQVRPGLAQHLAEDAPAYLAAYRFDDGEVAALAVTDLRLSAAAGAAIAGLPPDETWIQVQQDNALDEELREFLHEVVNVTSRLFNSPSTPHVRFREHVMVPGELSEDIAALALRPRVRHDWSVEIDGYGAGTVTFLA